MVEYPFIQNAAESARLVAQGQFFAECTERFLRAAGVEAATRVLDFGCGTGAVSELLAKVCGGGVKIVAFDRSAASGDFARSTDRRVEFVTGEDLPPGPTTADSTRAPGLARPTNVATLRAFPRGHHATHLHRCVRLPVLARLTGERRPG